jgi:hypothetical protein
MTSLQEMLRDYSSLDQSALLQRHKSLLDGKRKILTDLVSAIGSSTTRRDQVITHLMETYQPKGQFSFPEAEGFHGFTSLRFLYVMGKFLEEYLSPALRYLYQIEGAAKKFGASSLQAENLADILDNEKSLEILTRAACVIRDNGILSFGKEVKGVYKRALDHYKYLQKRFLNIGGDDNSRAYRDPREEDENGLNLSAVPYTKIELVRGNALLTDLLLDIAAQLPRQRIRKEKAKGKRKIKETKFLDQFDVEHSARVLVELSDPTYQEYITHPSKFLRRIEESLKEYYEIMRPVNKVLVDLLGDEYNNPATRIEINYESLFKIGRAHV